MNAITHRAVGIIMAIASISLCIGCEVQGHFESKPNSTQTPATSASPEKTHWIHVVDRGCCEEYDRCVRNSDGRILIVVMHAKDSPSDPFGVYKDGASYGDFETRNAAIEKTIQLQPECAVRRSQEGAK